MSSSLQAIELSQTVTCGLLPGRTFIALAAEQLQDQDYILARDAASGTNDAIGVLYQRHRLRVYSLCLRMTRNVAEAEDLTQDVFIQLLKKIGSFRGESHFTTWLYRLTVNQVLMNMRRAKNRKELDFEEIGVIHATLKHSKSTRSQLADRLALESAISQLPPGCRAVFRLFCIEGYRHEEIANIFGCSVGNSKSQLYKARKKLKRLLNKRIRPSQIQSHSLQRI